MKHIKRLSVIVTLILLIIPLPAQAQPPSKRLTIEKLVDAFEIAFGMDNLGMLDAKVPNPVKMRVEIEYQTIGPEIKVFRTFGEIGRWLRSRQTDGAAKVDGQTVKFPITVVLPRVGCKRGLCTYDFFDGAMRHNHLFIKKISYGYRKGRPYLKTIYLLSG